MNFPLKRAMALLLAGAASGAQAQSLEVDLGIPRLQVAEYHRPYVALWLARPDNSVAAHLAVLYDVDMENDEGEKWLKDLRQWWRRGGRTLDMPVDGVSAATRGPGSHQLAFADTLADLPPGDYRLLVEAAREVGGREMLEIPFSWPVAEPVTATAAGASELGTVTISLKP
ncbi:DUF2271 domain-containing protein [Haliea sp. E17]|uniref:DUF2271 domain-containing protein n=1 Tax=Haliea sp. E17 TaxID=3401576 RepID=UPI003AAA7A93